MDGGSGRRHGLGVAQPVPQAKLPEFSVDFCRLCIVGPCVAMRKIGGLGHNPEKSLKDWVGLT